jgi:hypothetical protein
VTVWNELPYYSGNKGRHPICSSSIKLSCFPCFRVPIKMEQSTKEVTDCSWKFVNIPRAMIELLASNPVPHRGKHNLWAFWHFNSWLCIVIILRNNNYGIVLCLDSVGIACNCRVFWLHERYGDFKLDTCHGKINFWTDLSFENCCLPISQANSARHVHARQALVITVNTNQKLHRSFMIAGFGAESDPV